MGLILFLLILGDILILAELIIIPGTIFTGLLGLGSIFGSCYLAYTNVSPTLSIVLFVINIIVLAVVTILLLRAKTWKKLTLNTQIESHVDKKPEEKGLQKGQTGVATTRLAPMGKGEFEGQVMEVTSEDGMIEAQVAIIITKIEDNKIFVKRNNS